MSPKIDLPVVLTSSSSVLLTSLPLTHKHFFILPTQLSPPFAFRTSPRYPSPLDPQRHPTTQPATTITIIMGVFGEKHTSLTREQKRQLIHQADTHKLRPTEVCDWVLATWGLRIARVTVYSILHKQRASLMAGHKDLYQSMQNSLNGLQQSAPASSTNTHNSDEACLERNKATGRISKSTSTSRSTGKRARSASSSPRDSSVASDLSSTVPVSYEAPTGEGKKKNLTQLELIMSPPSSPPFLGALSRQLQSHRADKQSMYLPLVLFSTFGKSQSAKLREITLNSESVTDNNAAGHRAVLQSYSILC